MFGALKNLFGGKDEAPATEYWHGKIGLTLMRYDNTLEAHVPTEIRRFDYFFKLTPEMRKAIPAADLDQRLTAVIKAVYREHHERFRLAEPNDINYIAVAEAAFRRLGAPEVAARAWQSSERPHWEAGNCLTVLAGDGYERVHPDNY